MQPGLVRQTRTSTVGYRTQLPPGLCSYRESWHSQSLVDPNDMFWFRRFEPYDEPVTRRAGSITICLFDPAIIDNVSRKVGVDGGNYEFHL